jgi:hypothetical protein
MTNSWEFLDDFEVSKRFWTNLGYSSEHKGIKSTDVEGKVKREIMECIREVSSTTMNGFKVGQVCIVQGGFDSPDSIVADDKDTFTEAMFSLSMRKFIYSVSLSPFIMLHTTPSGEIQEESTEHNPTHYLTLGVSDTPTGSTNIGPDLIDFIASLFDGQSTSSNDGAWIVQDREPE